MDGAGLTASQVPRDSAHADRSQATSTKPSRQSGRSSRCCSTRRRGSTTGADGTWAPAEGVNIVGANLKLKASDEVQIYNCDAETPVLADTFHGSEVDPEYGDVNTDPVLTINKEWVNAHSQNWGVKMGFKVVKKITVDNVEQTIESNMFVATKAS